MSLLQNIDSHLKDAMLARDKARLLALRNIKSFLKNKSIEAKGDLKDEEIFQALATLAKQRRESIEAFQKANREDLVSKETAELQVIKEFLPPPLSENELDGLIQEAVKETGAKGPKDMGLVMKALKPKVTGRAEGKVVSGRVQAALKDLEP